MLFKLSIVVLSVSLFLSKTLSAETCTGIAPPAAYLPSTPGLDFVNCTSLCGYYTDAPAAWGWTHSANLPSWGWDFMPSTYGYQGMNWTLDNTGKPSNRSYTYNGSPGPKSLVGIGAFPGGKTHSDVWLLTNQRTIHVSGGQKIKCANGADGANAPFIIVDNGEIRVGWIIGTPLSPFSMQYGLESKAFALQNGEIPLTFNVSSTGSQVGQWSIFLFGVKNTFVDSGLRVRSNNKTYSFAAEVGSQPSSPLRVYKNGKMLGLALVSENDPSATPVRVNTKGGPKAIRAYP